MNWEHTVKKQEERIVFDTELLQNPGERWWWLGPGGDSGGGNKRLVLDTLCAESMHYLLMDSVHYIIEPEE